MPPRPRPLKRAVSLSPAGYSGTPLPKKLGVKAGSLVVVVNMPDGFVAQLGAMPLGARLSTRAVGSPDLVVWFARSKRELDGRVASIGALVATGGGLWIAWPKKASGVVTDLTEDVVRGAGLAHGLVDYKVCAIDATWSGLKFARRKSS